MKTVIALFLSVLFTASLSGRKRVNGSTWRLSEDMPAFSPIDPIRIAGCHDRRGPLPQRKRRKSWTKLAGAEAISRLLCILWIRPPGL